MKNKISQHAIAAGLHTVAGQVMRTVLNASAHQGTKFLSPDLVVRVTHRKASGHARMQFEVTVGKPSYRERAFVAACQKAKEKFPVRKIWLHYRPKVRKAR